MVFSIKANNRHHGTYSIISKKSTVNRINDNIMKAYLYFENKDYRMANMLCVTVEEDIKKLLRKKNKIEDSCLQDFYEIKRKLVIQSIESKISKVILSINSGEKTLGIKYYEGIISELEQLSNSGFDIKIFRRKVAKLLSYIYISDEWESKNKSNNRLKDKSSELLKLKIWTKERCPELL